MAGALAVFGECLQTLVNELNVVGVDIETQQNQTTSGHSTYTIQEAKGFQYEVVVVLTVLLLPQVVLYVVEEKGEDGGGGGEKDEEWQGRRSGRGRIRTGGEGGGSGERGR